MSNVNTSTNVTIETENINLKVINHTAPEESVTYSPALLVNNETSEVRTVSNTTLQLKCIEK